jgi:hypothetical protein
MSRARRWKAPLSGERTLISLVEEDHAAVGHGDSPYGRRLCGRRAVRKAGMNPVAMSSLGLKLGVSPV